MTELRGVTWATRRGLDPLRAASAAFAQAHPGVTISWDALPWEEMRFAQRESLATASGRYDLVVVDHPWIGDYADAGWVIPVDGYMDAAQLAQVRRDADLASLSSYEHDGRLWALPVDAACQTLVVRPDLLAGLPWLDDLRDWDDVLAAAEAFHAPPERWGFVHSLNHGAGVLLFVLGAAAAVGADPYRTPGTRFDREAGAIALTLLRDIHRLGLPPAERAGRRPFDLMRDGDSFALWPAGFPYSELFVAGDRPPLRVLPMPAIAGGAATTGLGGAGLAVAAASRHRDVAAEFASFAISPQVQGELWIEHGGQPGLTSALRGSAMRAQSGDIGEVLAGALEDCYVRPTWPGWSWVEVSAEPVFASFAAGHSDIAQTLDALDALVAAGPRHSRDIDLSVEGN